MTWIKIILILSFLAVLVGAFRNRQRVELRAGSRVGGLALCLIAMVSIVDPDIPQRTAEKLGVTRGTDLILYMLVVIFVLTSLGLYFRSRESDRRLLELARAVAINLAVQSDGPPGAQTRQARSVGEAAGGEAQPDHSDGGTKRADSSPA